MTKSQVKATTRQPPRNSGIQACRSRSGGGRERQCPGVYLKRGRSAVHAMKQALLKALPAKAPGLTQAERFSAVGPHLPADQFPGGAKAGW